MSEDLEKYLRPTHFIDSGEPSILEFSQQHTANAETPTQKAIGLFYAVRDKIPYNLISSIDFDSGFFRASAVLERGSGFCIEKAVLLTAVCRSQLIPCRLRFADVRNHLTTRRVRALMETDLFVYHGYVEMLLGGLWVKASPAFDRVMCERHRVRPVEFDGKNDAILHEFDLSENRHIEYVRDHGSFADLPYDRIAAAFRETYPKMSRS